MEFDRSKQRFILLIVVVTIILAVIHELLSDGKLILSIDDQTQHHHAAIISNDRHDLAHQHTQQLLQLALQDDRKYQLYDKSEVNLHTVSHYYDTLRKATQPSKPYDICIVTRIRNIAYLLPQWIEYQKVIGVDHIYLADDCSTDYIDEHDTTSSATKFWGNYFAQDVEDDEHDHHHRHHQHYDGHDGQNQAFVTFYPNLLHEGNCSKHIPNDKLLVDRMVKDAEKSCHWIATTDIDEYFVIDLRDNYQQTSKHAKHSSALLDPQLFRKILPAMLQHYYLERYDQQLIRMPWMVMGHASRETRSPDLIIDTYEEGRWLPLIKTLAVQDYIKLWGGTHKPREFRWYAPHVGKQPLREYNRPFYITMKDFVSVKTAESNETRHGNIGKIDPVLSVDEKNCYASKSKLFVRHYLPLSWEDFSRIRGMRQFDSVGERNPFSGGRSQWEAYNFTTWCPMPGDTYLQAASLLVKQKIQERLMRYYHRYVTITQTESNKISAVHTWMNEASQHYIAGDAAFFYKDWKKQQSSYLADAAVEQK